MSKAELNNQIVLMRKDVVQARVHVVKKLARCVNGLRAKKGTESQKAKNLRKAERIAAEILAVKKAKKDEIIHFALTNSLELKDILQDESSDPLKRIKARIANHKKFGQKVAEFKAKYPNYLKLLEPSRKKKAQLERKAKRKEQKLKKKAAKALDKTKDESTENVDDNEDLDVKGNDDDDDNDAAAANESELDESDDSEAVEREEELDIDEKENDEENLKTLENEQDKEKMAKNVKKKKTRKLSLDGQEDQDVKSEKDSNAVDSTKCKKKKVKTVDATKAVSKLATVKKFTEILKEEDAKFDETPELVLEANPSNVDVDVEKEVDPFFVTDNGRSNFFSVAPRKRKVEEDENSQNAHNKFPKFKDDFKFASGKSNPKWKNQQNDGFRFYGDKSDYRRKNENDRNGRNYHVRDDKPRFNKFNDEREQKQMSRRERRSQMFEKEDDKHLHPSWEAKKKLQDALKVGFQGKKIVFGDD